MTNEAAPSGLFYVQASSKASFRGEGERNDAFLLLRGSEATQNASADIIPMIGKTHRCAPLEKLIRTFFNMKFKCLNELVNK